ncbi:hypothetical protein FHS18_002109 [Paenibacillus phyllosphaerae]|uniref:Elongation factor G-binding protein n=1 Tax=Paenibacillus phyllosphaerae TaxID=274593 RepID=A0A7W5AWU3_9BACL|nr:FusB/FusC family EF-G-binding protein [Paenibacillus phyllosphaerae]MBB3110042.1 hypothetical protein [Paenibacillus phyllosphaerae]
MQPFIRNHHYNFIARQTELLQQACRTVADLKVVDTVRSSSLAKIAEQFPETTEPRKQLLEQLAYAKTAEEFQAYLRSLELYRSEFGPVTEQQMKKLFPKAKKLKVPNLALMDLRHVTYIGWNDIGAGKMFLVYNLNGQLVGIEGRFTPSYKKGYCFVCNKQSEVGLFSAISKSRPAHASSDYYKAVGNYMCKDSVSCNRQLTDVANLERFIQNVIQVEE